MAGTGEMRTDPATVTTRGTVNMPSGIRKVLGIDESDELVFELDDSGVSILSGQEHWQILKA